MKLKDRIEKIKQLIDKGDLEAISKELDYWDNEIEQMFDDKENRIITAAFCGASMLIGFVLGIIIII